jgi:pimeloyl-[acyl-carrier protein] methyl ester esterase
VAAPTPKLVLMPGMDGTGNLFNGFVEALPDGFETTIVRYPADSVRSYGELLEFVLAEISVSDPFVLLAESFSTPLAIQYAAQNPPNLKGLILCAGFASSPVAGSKSAVAVAAVRLFMRVTPPAAVIKMFLVGRRAPASLVEAVRAAVSSVRSEVLIARAQSIFACDVREELARIAMPILYLRAMQDRLVPARCMEEVLNIHPSAEVASIPGSHLLLQREPKETAAAVASFLCQLGDLPHG